MNATTTASTQYDQHQAAITDLLNALHTDLRAHQRQFTADGRRDWGYPGDLAHVESLLREAHNFLNNIED